MADYRQMVNMLMGVAAPNALVGGILGKPVANAMYESGKGILGAFGSGMQGQPFDPGKLTYDLMNTVPMGGLLSKPIVGAVGSGVRGKLPVAEAAGKMPRMTPGRAKQGLQGSPDYVYHATNTERASEIAAQGLKPHKPWEFTDQSVWPDGKTEPRVYFSPRADNVWQFAPEDGPSAVLRVKKSHAIGGDGTGDVFARNKIDPKDIEIMSDDGQWHPISKLSD